jgi:hypothetical protein
METTYPVHLIVEASECPYWNYNTHTSCHTCNSCTCVAEGNNLRNSEFGIMINNDRYCMLETRVRAELVEEMRK